MHAALLCHCRLRVHDWHDELFMIRFRLVLIWINRPTAFFERLDPGLVWSSTLDSPSLLQQVKSGAMDLIG